MKILSTNVAYAMNPIDWYARAYGHLENRTFYYDCSFSLVKI